MKMSTIWLLLSTILAFSCKKQSIDPAAQDADYYIKFKANGNQVAYNSSNSSLSTPNTFVSRGALISNTTPFYQLLFYAQPSTTNEIVMSLISADSVRAGQSYPLSAGFTDGYAVIKIDGKTYSTQGQSYGSTYVITVNVAEYTNSLITGTFSGKLLYTSTSGSTEELEVSEGAFRSKVQ
jgi:hypothetical protein